MRFFAIHDVVSLPCEYQHLLTRQDVESSPCWCERLIVFSVHYALQAAGRCIVTVLVAAYDRLAMQDVTSLPGG